MIGDVLPAGVAHAESFGDVDVALFPQEAQAVARAVEKRRREFATVRWCARQALAQLGYPPAPVPPGERGCPVWPDGVVGSLTHCDGYRAAAVCRAASWHAIGIDAEPHDRLPAEVTGLVVRPEERDRLAELTAADASVCWDRLLFSAKEAVYKAWYPLARRWLDFQEASLTISPDGGFHARLLVDGPTLDGRPLESVTGRGWSTVAWWCARSPCRAGSEPPRRI